MSIPRDTAKGLIEASQRRQLSRGAYKMAFTATPSNSRSGGRCRGVRLHQHRIIFLRKCTLPRPSRSPAMRFVVTSGH